MNKKVNLGEKSTIKPKSKTLSKILWKRIQNISSLNVYDVLDIRNILGSSFTRINMNTVSQKGEYQFSCHGQQFCLSLQSIILHGVNNPAFHLFLEVPWNPERNIVSYVN